MQPKDREHIKANPWLEYLAGTNPDYAVNAMQNNNALQFNGVDSG
jgi:hypothetical protein